MHVQVDCVPNASEKLNHLQFCQNLLPRAAYLQGGHQIVAVHEHVNERVAQRPEIAIAPAVHLGEQREGRKRWWRER